ncbi:MAG: hypothetical protein U1F30_13225 [Steroidobacteraceae bacterium]
MIDAASGCTWWTFDAQASARTAVSVAMLPRGLVQGLHGRRQRHRLRGRCRERATGCGSADDRRASDAGITGAPVFRAGRLYVLVSSMEEVPATSSAVLWYTHVIAAEPRAYRRSDSGTQLLHRPAGGAVELADDRCAARLAVRRHRKFLHRHRGARDQRGGRDRARDRPGPLRGSSTARDNWVIGCAAPVINPCPPGDACRRGGVANCPKSVGPDADLAGPADPGARWPTAPCRSTAGAGGHELAASP